MTQAPFDPSAGRLQLWGGLECTVNRIESDYFNQIERNGHLHRDDDIARFASLGIAAIRYPVLWESTAPDGLAKANWSWPDRRLEALRAAGIAPIAGLVHHGSGPRHTSLIDDHFASGLAEFAGAVARRYPWVSDYTPVNEPLTTARFSALYGLWYPHGRSNTLFIRALLNQCKAIVLSMRAIRAVNPQARLVQTDDLGKTYSTRPMRATAAFYNERRWLAWDLLCGRVGPGHALWRYLTRHGATPAELSWFRANPCPPDVIGVNYYVTSERWLDHRAERFPAHYRGHAGARPCADIETARALATPTAGIGPLLDEVWQRYGIALAVTEAHIDANREDQLRWLREIWNASQRARQRGIDLRAVTVWALLGSYDWNSLVTQNKGYYEPGPFDVRGPQPRPTALAGMMRELAADAPLSHPVLHGLGWWRRSGRFLCPPIATRAGAALPPETSAAAPSPILITGATGTLGRAFARICQRRNLAYRLLTREEMDIANPASVERVMQQYAPWAVINASGYVRVDDAEHDVERCYRENVQGPATLAAICARHQVHLTTFSSDLVFDGMQAFPYMEDAEVGPLSIYGHSKAAAEQIVLAQHAGALIVRTSSFFGPWDSANFVTIVLDTLARGAPFTAVSDITVSPTYVPDLVHACLDLIIDRECGVWHLTNATALTWGELAHAAACQAGIDPGRLELRLAADFHYPARRPYYSALSSRRAILLPPLDDALGRYIAMRTEPEQLDERLFVAETRHVPGQAQRQAS
ncbi:family 1 glycosylhydrolase [Massilia sp. CF038]|uniref:family 1 glycosylhydrolase n=1 Tax=Massilia sp. CF038 TaxID=1881045 RepID=UPI000920EEFB|nr:family 1 glycosylhydrolase [Massilia sp. CF038]SHH17806.1 dTDP-4-dehydrorhamnose reductase [Massilia sp. CF038]